jgi:hypothetical protein
VNRPAVEPPSVVRRLESPSASTLVGLAETFEELQTVLRCCERLVAELTPRPAGPDPVVVEGVWTTALLSYARCFGSGAADPVLSEEDVAATRPDSHVLDWHKALLQLREHYVDPVHNPRERFTVGVAQGADGAPGGVAITSATQPLVDDVTVRQTGGIAYALSSVVNDRIEAQQSQVFEEVKTMAAGDLAGLAELDLLDPSPGTVASPSS